MPRVRSRKCCLPVHLVIFLWEHMDVNNHTIKKRVISLPTLHYIYYFLLLPRNILASAIEWPHRCSQIVANSSTPKMHALRHFLDCCACTLDLAICLLAVRFFPPLCISPARTFCENFVNSFSGHSVRLCQQACRRVYHHLIRPRLPGCSPLPLVKNSPRCS